MSILIPDLVTSITVLGENASLSPAAGGCWHSLTCGRITPSSASVVPLLPPVCVDTLLPFFYKDILMTLRAYTGNPGQSSRFKISNFFTSVKTPFPNEVTFVGSRDEDLDISFGGPLFNPPHSARL